MIHYFKGRFYLAGSSLSLDVEVEADEEGRIAITIEDDRFSYVKGEYDVEPRLGSLRRVISFREGARFETEHCDAFESFEMAVRTSRWPGVVDWFERRWAAALGCVIAVALASVAFVYWGIPALASIVANEVPQSMRVSITEQSLDTMKRFGQLKTTRLSVEEVQRSQLAFGKALALAHIEDSGFAYRLLNYDMGGVENAFALPSGTIVATDSFTRMCENENQMVAVFLHEIAHVEKQHGIRSIVQRTGIFVLASMVLGDVSAVANVTSALPALVIESQYSQRFEMESDTFAAEILEDSGIGADAMKDVLILLHKDAPDVPVATFLSSHPSLQERVENLERIEEGE